MPVGIAEVDRPRRPVVAHCQFPHLFAALGEYRVVADVSEERVEPGSRDAKGDEVDAHVRAITLRLAREQGELRPGAGGEHQWTGRIVGPVFVLRRDGQPKRALVPRRRHAAIRNEQLDVIDLIDTELGHWQLHLGPLHFRDLPPESLE